MNRKVNRLLFVVFSILIVGNAWGQRTCGTDSVHAHMMGLPGYDRAYTDRLDAANAAASDRLECDVPLLIPVAVHFQSTGIPIDCAIEMAVSQVQTLNEDFAATNGDLAEWVESQPTIWPSIDNGESCISFCLATLDHPDGFGLDEGDYAVTLDQTTGDSDASWSGYLNFFVRTLGGGTLGYSPLGGNGSGDGVTCDPQYFGSVACGGNTISGSFDMGRTITHEVGHYLFLEHPWGGGGCAGDDFVADTPATDGPQFGCPSGQNIVNCTAPILWPSYMDYCDDACLFMFSEGQVARMETYVTDNLQNLLNSSTTACEEALCIGFDVAVNVVGESCNGNDGSVVASSEGGLAPYEYVLNGALQVGNGSFSNLPSNAYTLEVLDGNSCVFSQTITLVQDDPDLEVVSVVNEHCSDGAGQIAVQVNESSTFDFSINAGESWQDSGSFVGLSGGTYTIDVQNVFGCQGSVEVEVLNTSELDLVVESKENVRCTWFDNGSIDVRAVGGDEPYVYVYNDTETSSSGDFTLLPVGDHLIRVEDAVGCVYEEVFALVNDFSNLGNDCPCSIYVPNAFTPDGDLQNEVWEVKASCPVSGFHVQVYDRWGVLVFESMDAAFFWHGGVNGYYLDAELFLYRITYQWGEEENASVETEVQTGYVSILR